MRSSSSSVEGGRGVGSVTDGQSRLGRVPADPAYRVALLDWLACAAGGAEQPAVRAARASLSRVAVAGAAGHVLDFDDTWLPGLVHLSAAAAPAALCVTAERGGSVDDAVTAYAEGFEWTAALSGASHPALYERGWHPTAVCGTVGAAVAAATALGLDEDGRRRAIGLAVLRAAGLQTGFGTDGKALQVGMAAAAGVDAARLAAAGASGPASPGAAFEAAYGGVWAEPGGATLAVRDNWIKAYPCCLQTHSAIEAAAAAEYVEGLVVVVHPVSRRAAAYDDVADGLQAKFSIPYLVAFTLLHGPPTVASFDGVDGEARALAEGIAVRTDPSLRESEACLEAGGVELSRVQAALGSPWRPMDEAQLAGKVRSLAGSRLDGVLDDPGRPAADLLAAAGV
jgi:2-methylcitrate dehydratase PrpD